MNNLNDLKNKRKGIRNLISVTKSITSVPNTLFQNNEPITDPKKKKQISSIHQLFQCHSSKN